MSVNQWCRRVSRTTLILYFTKYPARIPLSTRFMSDILRTSCNANAHIKTAAPTPSPRVILWNYIKRSGITADGTTGIWKLSRSGIAMTVMKLAKSSKNCMIVLALLSTASPLFLLENLSLRVHSVPRPMLYLVTPCQIMPNYLYVKHVSLNAASKVIIINI